MEHSDDEIEEMLKRVINPKTKREKEVAEKYTPYIDERVSGIEDINGYIQNLVDNPPSTDVSPTLPEEERDATVKSIGEYRKKHPDVEEKRLKELQRITKETDFGDKTQLRKLSGYCNEVYVLVKRLTETKK